MSKVITSSDVLSELKRKFQRGQPLVIARCVSPVITLTEIAEFTASTTAANYESKDVRFFYWADSGMAAPRTTTVAEEGKTQVTIKCTARPKASFKFFDEKFGDMDNVLSMIDFLESYLEDQFPIPYVVRTKTLNIMFDHKSAEAIRKKHSTTLQQCDSTVFLGGLGPYLVGGTEAYGQILNRLLLLFARVRSCPRKSIVLIMGHDEKIPEALTDFCAVVEQSMPTSQTIRDQVWPSVWHRVNRVRLSQRMAPYADLIQSVVGTSADDLGAQVGEALCGLTQHQVVSTLNETAGDLVHEAGAEGSITTSEQFLRKLYTKKTGATNQIQGLTVSSSIPEADVGGMSYLRQWITSAKHLFSKTAHEMGLDRPNGLLLVGPPGCGKTYIAKAIAGILGVPFITLDIGSLMNKYVGASEGNLDAVIRHLSSIGDCVLLLDEIEKSLGGDDTGGPKRVMVGKILGWLSEQNKAFVIGTANDLTTLRPELKRSGRFDRTMVVDLPREDARAEILKIYVGKLNQDFVSVNQEDVETIAHLTTGFSAADLKQLVNTAGTIMLSAGANSMDVSHMNLAMSEITPAMDSMGPYIESIRAVAKQHSWKDAAGPEENEMSGQKFEILDLETDIRL